MQVPKQTAEIFEILSRGQFISSNATNDYNRKLYNILDEAFDDLYDYFLNINFRLEKGDEYYYFSRGEAKVDLERKIDIAFRWIDILDFLKTFDNAFSSGYRFSPSDILVRLNMDSELKTKLESLKKYSGGKEKFTEIVDWMLERLKRDNFIELENEISHSWKVLASFNYLEQLILTISIPEETKNEIPK